MAIITSDYLPINYKGKELLYLRINKDDHSKFMVDFRVNSKRYRKVFTVNGSTRGKNIELAQFELKKCLSEVPQTIPLNTIANSMMNMRDYFARLCYIKRNSWSDGHKEKMEGFFNKYVEPIIGDKAVSSVKPSDITNIASNISHLSKRSQKRLTEVLHPIFELAIEDESIQVSPIKKSHRITRKLVEEKRVIYNAVDKYKKVHASIMKLFEDNPVMRAIMLFGFYGRRKNEVLSLTWENIDLKNNTFIIPKEKSKVGVDLEFALPEEIKTALNEIAKFTGKEGLVFQSPRGGQYTEIRDHIYAIRKDTGIEEFGFHWMRNLAVSALSSQGVDAIHLSSLLGHTDTHTVKQYLSLQRKESSGKLQEVSKSLLS